MDLGALGQELRGSLTLYIQEPTGKQLTILPDPLGGGLVFTHEDADGWAASSDLAALVSLLRMMGKEPRKSFSYVAAYVATGSGGLIESSYEGVNVLPQYSYVTIQPGRVQLCEYASAESLFAPEVAYGEALDQVEGDIVRNVVAVAESSHARKVAHLTGGVDSRILLSAILAAGKAHEFVFYCSGGPTEPDQIIARQLASEYGLTMTKHPGLEYEVLPETLEEQLLQPFKQTSGIISGPALGGMRPSPHLIASGGYGELFRSFYNRGATFTGGSQEAAAHMFGALGFSPDPTRRILADGFMHDMAGSVAGIMGGASIVGVRDDALMDFVYLNRRNRYYVGEISRSVSEFSARVDPLYSVAGASFGLRTEGRLRNANVIGVDLIERFTPGLAHLPFDSDKLGGIYAAVRGPQKVNTFSRGGVPSYDAPAKVTPLNGGNVKAARLSATDIQRANELRMSPRLMAQFPQIQSGLRELVANVPPSVFDSTFNRKVVDTLIRRTPSNRVQYRTARDLYAGLLWYSHG
ncbi:hypothetical protein [Arthrobacter luteolus]|uniref:hypothetical protein n=1 Tax=Arthrobacter luteolus TaxID=98672 RepID=UPI00384E3366